MNYIEFKSQNGRIHCTGYEENVKTQEMFRLEDEAAKELFSLLNNSKYEYKTEYRDNVKMIRFYNVDKEILFCSNRNNRISTKVTRKNKIKDLKGPISVGLAFAIFLTGAIHLHKKKNEGSYSSELPDEKEVTDEYMSTSSVEIEDDSKKFDIEIPTEEFVSVEPDYQEKEDKVLIPESYFDYYYEDRSQTDKAIKTKNLYYDVIDKYSKTYGLPTNLMLAVATQERGVHSDKIDSDGGFGLFQIQMRGSWNWYGKTVSAINFETGEREYLTIGLREDGSLDENMVGDLEYNTRAACMIMSSNIEYCKGDIICALQCNNSGTKPLKLKSSYGDDWVNHRSGLAGDPEYLEHVLSYVPANDNIFVYKDANFNEHCIGVYNATGYTNVISR